MHWAARPSWHSLPPSYSWHVGVTWLQSRRGLAQRSAQHAQDHTRIAPASYEIAQGQSVSQPPYQADAERWASMAAFDVSGVFDALEAAQVDGVRVTSIDLQAHSREVLVEVEGPDLVAILKYIERLNASNPAFSGAWRVLRTRQDNGLQAAALARYGFPSSTATALGTLGR